MRGVAPVLACAVQPPWGEPRVPRSAAFWYCPFYLLPRRISL